MKSSRYITPSFLPRVSPLPMSLLLCLANSTQLSFQLQLLSELIFNFFPSNRFQLSVFTFEFKVFFSEICLIFWYIVFSVLSPNVCPFFTSIFILVHRFLSDTHGIRFKSKSLRFWWWRLGRKYTFCLHDPLNLRKEPNKDVSESSKSNVAKIPPKGKEQHPLFFYPHCSRYISF